MKKSVTKIRTLRQSIGLNQSQFWSRTGVTQSCGSRYESGRRLPKPIQILIDIAYGPHDISTRTINQLLQGEAPAPVKPAAKKEVRMATAAKKVAAPAKKAAPAKAPAKAVKAPAKAAVKVPAKTAKAATAKKSKGC